MTLLPVKSTPISMTPSSRVFTVIGPPTSSFSTCELQAVDVLQTGQARLALFTLGRTAEQEILRDALEVRDVFGSHFIRLVFHHVEAVDVDRGRGLRRDDAAAVQLVLQQAVRLVVSPVGSPSL